MSATPTAPEATYPPPAVDPVWLPPPRPPRPTLPTLRWPQLLALGVAAALGNLALQSQVAALASTMAAVVIAGPVLGERLRRSWTSVSFAVGAIVFAVWLPVRASGWLTGLNASAVMACLAAAAATAAPVRFRMGTASLRTLTSRLLFARFFGPLLIQAAAPLRSAKASRLVPLVRGIAIAIVPVTVLGALLASADAVFAQSFSMNLRPESFIEHGLVTLFAFAGIAGLVAVTGVADEGTFEDRRPLGATEALVLLGSIGALYGAFAVVQLLNVLGRTNDIVTAQGLSYSEYARSGFFQLLWVAALTLLLLGVVRLLVTQDDSALHTALRAVGAAVAALTTLIVAVAVVRLGLYTDEFGQTTLRWYCTAFALMLGALFVVIAIGHVRRTEHLVPAAVLTVVAITLFSANLLNPEARVAEHNLNRADAVQRLDAAYITRLSADAWPTILEHQSLVESRLQGTRVSFDQLCERADEANGYGIFGFNLAHSRLTC